MSEKDQSPSPSGEFHRYIVAESDSDPGERAKAEKQAVRRMDFKLLGFINMLFLLVFLDQTTQTSGENFIIGGLEQQLKRTAAQFQMCSTVLFVPYISTELMSTLFLRKMGPNILIPVLVTFWGVVLISLGVVTDAAGLATVKAFLGSFLWPLAPCIVCYLSGFYTRKELSLRIALLFSSASLFAGLSGWLGSILLNLHGFGGKPVGAWVSILNGFFTILNGVAGFFLIPATPRDCKFLTSEQKELIISRLERDRPSIVPFDKFTLGEVLHGLAPHVVLVSILLFMAGTAQFGLAMSLPSTVSKLGFSGYRAQLLSLGPFFLGFLVTLKSAYLSDRHQSRGVVTALLACVAAAGYLTFFATNNKFVAYGSLYLMVPGIYGTTPPLFAWLANNSEPYYRRATSIAFGFIAGNSGCVLGTRIIFGEEGPQYRKTAFVNLIFSILIAVGSLLNIMYLSWKNKSKTRLGRREVLLQKYSEDEDGGLKAWMELGAEHPDFQYTL